SRSDWSLFFFFFFSSRRRHTRFSRDWSSDVCSSDLDYQGRQVCVSSNEDTLTLTDVTDKANPVLISRGFYPNPAYTHQGWFTEDQRYFLVDDELDEITGLTSNTRTIVFDHTDLDDPEFDFFSFSEP